MPKVRIDIDLLPTYNRSIACGTIVSVFHETYHNMHLLLASWCPKVEVGWRKKRRCFVQIKLDFEEESWSIASFKHNSLMSLPIRTFVLPPDFRSKDNLWSKTKLHRYLILQNHRHTKSIYLWVSLALAESLFSFSLCSEETKYGTNL
jgi:hypothetical protein